MRETTMGIFSFLGASPGILFKPNRYSERRLRDDIDNCEALISRAELWHITLSEHDVDAVRTARSSLANDTWREQTETAFYEAAARIAAIVQYPDPIICEDLEEAMQLVSHAAQTGKLLDADDIQAVSNARESQRSGTWTSFIEAAFYAATCRISRAVAPVSAETAGTEARYGARKAIRAYTLAAIGLTICVSLLSCLLFVIIQASQDISAVVKENDAGALNLHNQLQAHAVMIFEAEKKSATERDAAILALQNSQPALAIKDQLQTFATNNRQLYADVKRINALYGLIGQRIPSPYKRECANTGHEPSNLLFSWSSGPSAATYGGIASASGLYGVAKDSAPLFRFPDTASTDWQCDPEATRAVLEITLPMLGHRLNDVTDLESGTSQEDVVDQGFQKIAAYQDIRSMAMYVRDIILAFVGAVTAFLLPILYASLGACAAILRQLSSDCAANVFHPEHSKVTNRSHVMTAVIVGISIGLFSDLVEGGKSVSPLAIAFVAGYASDKFFRYLDSLVETLFPTRASSGTGGAATNATADVAGAASNAKTAGVAARQEPQAP
jgi:hypothetical protein